MSRQPIIDGAKLVCAAAAAAISIALIIPEADSKPSVPTVASINTAQFGCTARAGRVEITMGKLQHGSEYNLVITAGKSARNSTPLYTGTHTATTGSTTTHRVACPDLGPGDFTITLRSRDTDKVVASGAFAIR